ASLSDEALLGSAPAAPAKNAPPAKGAAAPRPAKSTAPADGAPIKGWTVYARLGLSVALGIGMVVWPYEVRCGVGLFGYLAAVAVVISSGVWSSVWTWRHRASRAH